MKFIQFTLYLLLAVAALFWGPAGYAQTTVTADWTNLGKASLEAVNDGESLDVGVNVITIDTNVVSDGDGNDANFTNFYSTDHLSYFAGTVSDQTGPLLFSNDHIVFDEGDFFEATFTLDTAVTNLTFTVGHVDRSTTGSIRHDGVIIEYDTGDSVWRNVRNLGGSFTLGSAVENATIGGQLGFDGVTAEALNSTDGDIEIDFGATTVERFRIRYKFGQDFPGSDPTGGGQFISLSDLVWTQTVANADLSLAKSVNNSTPANGTAITYTLNLTNAASSSETATGVTVTDLLPPGADYDSHSGFGTYDPATGAWSVSSIAPGQTRTLTIEATVNVTNGTTVTNIAEVTASSEFDSDSTPNNGITTEDDYDTASFTVTGTRTAGVPPTLFCPAGTNLFDWDTRAWPAGSLNENFVMANFGTVNIAISTDGTFLSDATFGGQTPALGGAATGGNTGGSAANGLSLHQLLDFDNIFQTATTVITLPNGIAGTQFTVFDVDFANNDFADKVTVTGSYQGATVIPTLTNGIANYVSGNVAIGDATAGNTSGDANVVVTFDQPIDTITIVYGNHTTAPAVPDGQAYTFHDFTFCAPSTSLSVLKTSAVFSDPVNNVTNPKAVPGALMEYNILVSNTGISDTDSDTVVITDNVPPETKFCLADLGGGGSGPIRFIDGASGSDLTYSFAGLGDAGDDLFFSNDNGATYTYTPTADADGCDNAITNFRVIPDGNFAGGSSFTLQARFIIE
ncbi:DUF11 domain-containing protein [Qipengyuania sp. DGS5-3]|uniref:DUF11 domain-containing protein n=1 Tax=Qipengyuania sp. DGS5-3 TaxID=3349632 RepID=UPI0036D3626D